jgi:hypothetical protein
VMGAAGRERALAMQWSAMAARYMEIFEQELEKMRGVPVASI